MLIKAGRILLKLERCNIPSPNMVDECAVLVCREYFKNYNISDISCNMLSTKFEMKLKPRFDVRVYIDIDRKEINKEKLLYGCSELLMKDELYNSILYFRDNISLFGHYIWWEGELLDVMDGANKC